MARKKKNWIDHRNGFQAVVMEDMEIWDGADLALLRETLARLVDQEKHQAIGVDMTCVKYIPSGFFGMLYDYRERNVEVRLYAPQAHVQAMLWFREFFEESSPGVFDLCLRPQTRMSIASAQAVAAAKAPWSENAPEEVDMEAYAVRREELASASR